ncbi:hypothetical protein NCCP28_10340 [Niallia sp. NCCP-28]|nr:hypothetical protein NCCP28_10340 [Niallia sp. NCCP-28]
MNLFLALFYCSIGSLFISMNYPTLVSLFFFDCLQTITLQIKMMIKPVKASNGMVMNPSQLM